ncbi:TPA: hypothetical protein ACIJ0T_005240, partial [Escherichia coli]
GNYLLECKFASWYSLSLWKLPCAYLSAFLPSGSVALSHSSRCWYLILVQVVRCKLGCVHAPFASLPAGYT